MDRNPDMTEEFEAWVINNELRYDLQKEEDEFGLDYYVDLHTVDIYKAFNAGFIKGSDSIRA